MPKQVVVIGAGQGGLSAAIYARLRGHDVLVIEQQDRSGGKAAGIDRDGYRLDCGPSIIILPSIYEGVFRDAGKSMEAYLRFRRLDPIARIYFEGQKPVDLPADAERCLRVLGEIAPQDLANLRKLLLLLDEARPHVEQSIFDHPYHSPVQLLDRHLIAMGMAFDVRLSYLELADRWFQSPLLRAFFYGFPSYGGQTYDSKAPGALMIPYFMIRDGVYYPEGGVAAIPKAFERLARDLGVRFRFGRRVSSLKRADHEIRAVLLDDGTAFEADAVISNVDRMTTRAWLGDSSGLEPSFSYFTMQWGLPSAQPQLAHHTLCIPARFEEGFSQLYREKSFPQEPVVYLNQPQVNEPGSSRGGLLAVVTSPAVEPYIDWEAEAGEYRRRTLGVMRRCGLGIDVESAEFEQIQTPLTFRRRDGNYKGSLYGADEKYRLFGLFPPRVLDEEYRNLFYCGGSVQPGAGLPMVTLSGKFAASLVK